MKRFYFPIGATLYALGFGAFFLGYQILGWAFLAIPITFILVDTIRNAVKDYREYHDLKFLTTPLIFVLFIATVILIDVGGTFRIIGCVMLGLITATVLGIAWYGAIKKKDSSHLL